MKNLMTFFGAIIFASFIFTSCGNSCNDFAGVYTGTSEMGSTNGTSKITINDDCSATLVYRQDGMESTFEHGNIIKNGSTYSFKSSSGGGTYDLKISKNQIVLDGYNWHCVLTK